MRIAKIVKSNSHIDYVGRVIDSLDANDPPAADDYGFAQFVSMPISDETEIVGVIYDSELLNPEYASFGPRLSPKPDLAVLSPDYLNEQGLLIGILLLGWRDLQTNENHHGVPRRVVPVNQEVYLLDENAVTKFHQTKDGTLQIHYYSQLIGHSGLFGVPLIEAIVEKLSENCTDEDKNRLNVLKNSLNWQRTMSQMRL